MTQTNKLASILKINKFWEQEAFWVVNKISLELGD